MYDFYELTHCYLVPLKNKEHLINNKINIRLKSKIGIKTDSSK